jgi:predicted permease
MAAGLVESFLGAIQASLSVLLVISYGGLAARLKLIDRKDTRAISRMCVRIFLPALLITKVGAELHAENADRYLVILVYGIITHIVSFLVGTFGHRVLGFPQYTTVAILINNTTSYPLLLMTALEETGILRSLIVTDETTKDAVERAKAYFLVYSTINNCITFAVGPRVLEEGDDADDLGDSSSESQDETPNGDVEANEQTRLLDSHLPHSVHSPAPVRRSSFLLPKAQEDQKPDHRRPWFVPRRRWNHMSPRMKWWSLFILDFFNAPLLGALIGTIIGLVPVFHRAFFNSSEDGGIFSAWLTSSLKSVGGLFVSLPVVVVGITLFCSTKEAYENNENVFSMPWLTLSYIVAVRFIAWPAVSISTIYILATKTALLGSDPILWFCLMMMPTGPSAMKLITLVQVAEGSKDTERQISKLLTVSQLWPGS